MRVTHVRLGSIVEWLIAASAILAGLAVCSAVWREAASVRAVVPVMAGDEILPEAPARVLPGAVSVPLVVLPRGKAIYIGDKFAEVSSRLGPTSEVGAETTEQTSAGARVTRRYRFGGSEFVLVFAPAGSDRALRVSAIYLH